MPFSTSKKRSNAKGQAPSGSLPLRNTHRHAEGCTCPSRNASLARHNPPPRRYALEYLKSNWDRLREFGEAFSGVNIDDMRKIVQPLLVAEGGIRVGCLVFQVVTSLPETLALACLAFLRLVWPERARIFRQHGRKSLLSACRNVSIVEPS